MSDAGYRALSAAVLLRALKDAQGMIEPRIGREHRREIRQCAKDFLSPDDELFAVYCGLLNYDPTAFAEAAKIRGGNVARLARRTEKRRAG